MSERVTVAGGAGSSCRSAIPRMSSGRTQGAALEGAGLLMGEVAPVGGEGPAEEAVSHAGLGHAVVQNSPEVGDDRGGVGNGGGVGDGARDVADTVVDHALLNIAGILMGGLMEGLDGPVVIMLMSTMTEPSPSASAWTGR